MVLSGLGFYGYASGKFRFGVNHSMIGRGLLDPRDPSGKVRESYKRVDQGHPVPGIKMQGSFGLRTTYIKSFVRLDSSFAIRRPTIPATAWLSYVSSFLERVSHST